MQRLETMADWTEARQRPVAVLYKHSPICGLSHRALPHVERVAEARPDVPVYAVDVIQGRAVSDRIAADVGVRHESPQVIILSAGALEWHASHRDVTADGILNALAAVASSDNVEAP
jgi:bacillithiol system protein YtxJ